MGIPTSRPVKWDGLEDSRFFCVLFGNNCHMPLRTEDGSFFTHLYNPFNIMLQHNILHTVGCHIIAKDSCPQVADAAAGQSGFIAGFAYYELSRQSASNAHRVPLYPILWRGRFEIMRTDMVSKINYPHIPGNLLIGPFTKSSEGICFLVRGWGSLGYLPRNPVGKIIDC